MPDSNMQTIVVPGLFDALETWHHDFEFVPQAEKLSRQLVLLKRHVSGLQGYLPTVYNLLGLTDLAGDCYRYEFGKGPDRAVLCVAPIELDAGLNDIGIGQHVIDDLDDAEQDSLLQLLNGHFAQDGWEFVVSGSNRWYLLLPEEQRPHTTIPLDQALGASLRGLIEGKEHVQWSRQLNELQMLLHSSMLNQARANKRKTIINSLWMWNVESKGRRGLSGRPGYIEGGGFFGRVVAHALEIEWKDADLSIPQSGNGFFMLNGLQDYQRINDLDNWQITLNGLEARILTLLQSGSGQSALYSSNGFFWRTDQKNPLWSRLLQRKKTLIDLSH